MKPRYRIRRIIDPLSATHNSELFVHWHSGIIPTIQYINCPYTGVFKITKS